MRSLILTAVLCLCAFPLTVQAAPPLAENLPAGTLIYAGWAGRNLPFDGSLLGQLINEPAVGHIMAAVHSAISKQIPGENEGAAFRHGWAIAGVAWQRPMALAILDFKMEPVESEPAPAAALLIELGRDKHAFDKHLGGILATLDDELTVAEATVGKVTYKTAEIEHIPISWGYMNGLFFFAIGEDVPRQLIQLTPAGALSANKKFAASFQSVGGENMQLAYYVDVPVLMDRIDALMPPPEGGAEDVSDLRRIVNALGLGKATALAGCVRVVDRGMYTKVRLFTPAPHRGLLIPAGGTALSEEALAGVPADADYVAAFNLAPDAAYNELRRVVKEIDPDADKEFADAVAEFEKEVGLSLTKDILANLGETWVISSAASRGGFLTGTVLTVQVRDAEKLAAAAAKLEAYLTKTFGASRQFGKTRVESFKSGQAEIRYLTMSKPFPLPVAPAWAIHKNKLYVAAWPQVIQSAIENGGQQSPLLRNEAFARARARIAGKPSAMAYVNTPNIVAQTYSSALVLSTMGLNALAGELGVEARPHWLPPISKLQKYLRPQISAMSADAEGVTFEGYGSVPTFGLAMTPTVAPAVVSLAIPALARARVNAQRVVSMSNLRNIGTATMMYAAEGDDQPPQDLAALIKSGQNPDMLVSPLSGRKAPKLVKGKLVGEVDYILLKLPRLTDLKTPSRTILAYERPENYGQKGTAVLFADGHVEWMKIKRFREALDRTALLLKKAEAAEETEDF